MLYGTAKSLKKFRGERPSAGKTGTTDDYRDAWFVGYTPQLLTGVWVGYDRPRPGGRSFTGGAVAAPIWEKFMRQALLTRPVADFPKPETVVTIPIDPLSGCLASPGSPGYRDELFIAGTEHSAECNEDGGEQPSDPLRVRRDLWVGPLLQGHQHGLVALAALHAHADGTR